jgi:hypothetical protein
MAAAALLTLPDEGLGELVHRVSQCALRHEPLFKDTKLRELGAGCLNVELVVSIIDQRM